VRIVRSDPSELPIAGIDVLDRSPLRVIVVSMDGSGARVAIIFGVCATLLRPTALKAVATPDFEVGLVLDFSSLRGIPPAIKEAAIAEAGRIWAPVNVTVGSIAVDDALDQRQVVQIVETPMSVGQGLRHELAEVRFTDGVPTARIGLYVDALHAMIDDMIRIRFPRFQPPAPISLLTWGQVLGRVLAHEIGHYILRSPHHERAGLMRAVHWTTEFSDPAGLGFRLTQWDADRLRALVASRVLRTKEPRR
jgi:hypothetical protein